jgi:hypothetical protein
MRRNINVFFGLFGWYIYCIATLINRNKTWENISFSIFPFKITHENYRNRLRNFTLKSIWIGEKRQSGAIQFFHRLLYSISPKPIASTQCQYESDRKPNANGFAIRTHYSTRFYDAARFSVATTRTLIDRLWSRKRDTLDTISQQNLLYHLKTVIFPIGFENIFSYHGEHFFTIIAIRDKIVCTEW